MPPISSGGGGAPVAAPYLLNGPDVSGTLTSAVDVLDLATPQPFVATAPFIGGQLGAPVTIDYANGAGSVGDGVILPARLQNNGNTQFIASAIQTEIVDATAGAEITKVTIQPATAGSIVGGIEVTSNAVKLFGSGAKLVTTSSGSLTMSSTGLGSTLAIAAGGEISIGAGVSGPAEINITASGQASYKSNQGNVTLATGGGAFDVLVKSGRNIVFSTTNGSFDRWAILSATGELAAQGAGAKVTNLTPGTTTGDAVAYQQVLLGAVAAPTNGGPAVNATPGACMIASAEFTAPTGGSGTFLLKNNTGASILIVGARVLIPSAGATTLACSVSSLATTLFENPAITAPGGTHLPATTSYTVANATIANGANIIIEADGSVATVDTIIFVEYIQL